MSALVMGVGMLFVARSEAQRAADAAALAAASTYLENANPWNAIAPAKQRAKDVAANNVVRGIPVDTTEISDTPLITTTEELTIEVIPDSFKVRVRVMRDSIRLYFAPVLGMQRGYVAARAAAEAAEAGSIQCLKPWAIPDENYSEMSLGTLDTLKIPSDEMFDPGYDPVDSWFYAIQLPEHDPTQMTKTSCWGPLGDAPTVPKPASDTTPCADGNARCEARWGDCPESPGTGSCWYRSYICNDNCQDVPLNATFTVEKGNMIGPSSQAVNDMIMRDPNAYYDEATGTVRRGPMGTIVNPEETSRIIKVGLYDPYTYTHPDQYSIALTGFAYFLIEPGPYTYKGRVGLYDPDLADAIIGRFLFYAQGSAGGSQTTPFTRFLRLVE